MIFFFFFDIRRCLQRYPLLGFVNLPVHEVILVSQFFANADIAFTFDCEEYKIFLLK